jgi:hypothetical protein
MPADDDPVRSALDFWCTCFISRKAGSAVVYSTISRKLLSLLEQAFMNSHDEGLGSVKAWLQIFSQETEEVEIGTRHEFNLEMLALFRRNAHRMTESGKVILLNVINFFDSSPL